MDKYLSANKILERWNRRDFQLFDLCKKGKLQAYNKYGKRIVDLDSCEKTKKLSYEVILYMIRMREGPKLEGNSFIFHPKMEIDYFVYTITNTNTILIIFAFINYTQNRLISLSLIFTMANVS